MKPARTLRPRPFDNKKKLPVVHDAAGLDLGDATVARSIAKRNSELEKNNDKVVTVAKNGEEVVPVPGFKEVPYYEQLYPTDFKNSEDMNAEYLTSDWISFVAASCDVTGGKVPLPTEGACVEYAADSEDEDWLDGINSEGQERLSAGNFEKLVWKLELTNAMFTSHALRKGGASMMERKTKTTSGFVHHVSKANAVKLLAKHEGFDPIVIERVYDYWLRKRRCRKEPLLRTLQPKTLATDRDPDHTFREREKIKRPNLRRRRQVNRGDNVEEKLLEIKDEMGHACNILRSMINRESVKAHVVSIYIAQKKMLLENLKRVEKSGSSRLKEIQKDQAKKQRQLKKDDAAYRSKVCRLLLHNIFRGDVRKMFACPLGTDVDGNAESAVARRLKKAQKRRQKWISYLVQDRNWHDWHDKTWMQKMFLLLRKRYLAGRAASYRHEMATWEKWEAFVKVTRDRRLKRLFDQKRSVVAKSEKSKRPKIGEKSTPSSVEASRQLPSKKSASDTEVPEFHEGMKGVEMSIVNWAKKFGIAPPEKPELTRTIRIPESFKVPHQGFPCLPPQLKKRYLEAERDVLQPPTGVLEKLKGLKKRRRSIKRYATRMHRSDAVLEIQKMRSMQWKKDEKRKKMRRIKNRILRHETASVARRTEYIGDGISKPAMTSSGTSPGSMSVDEETEMKLPLMGVTEATYKEVRRKLLVYLKERVRAAKDAVQSGTSVDETLLRYWVKCFASVKAAKEPDVPRLNRLMHDIHSSRRMEDRMEIDKEGRSTPKKPKGSQPTKRDQGKKIKLSKRRHRRLILELRWNGRRRTIDLEPGRRFPFRPFEDGGRRLDVRELRRRLEAAEKLPTEDASHDPTAVDLEESVSTHWNDLCSREGPIAHVPVQSHRLIKTSSAPLLVTEDYRLKSKSHKLTLGLAASRRLIKGQGVSLSTLQRRRKLRHAMMQPTVPRNVKCRELPRTKRSKIKALSRVSMDVPSRPERKPMFSHVFQMSRTMPIEKTPATVRLPSNVPEAFAESGVLRIGRGSRVWMDRVDPMDLQPCSFPAAFLSPAIDRLRPTLKRVLRMDESKTQRLKHRSNDKPTGVGNDAEKFQTSQPPISDAPSVDRKHKFLPHWTIRPDVRATVPKATDGGRGGAVDVKNETVQLHGAALEMGLELPIDRLQEAVAMSREEITTKQEASGRIGPRDDSKILRTESGSVVNVDYLSSIAPRKPRTSLDARSNSQRSRS